MAYLHFAENLTRLQEERGETNYRLAAEIGVHQTSIANWKKLGRKPYPKTVRKIARHYGVTVDELLGREPTFNVNEEDE